MRSVNMYYTDFLALETFVHKLDINDSPSLLIQVFTSRNDIVFIQEIVQNISHLLPQAKLIGSTTDGEIMSGKVSTYKTVISFTSFEYTTLKVHASQHKRDGYFTGKLLAETLIEKDTKLLIAFSDGLNTNGEYFLKGINEVDSTVMIAGGLAGDNAIFKQTYVFTKDKILDDGAVAVALNSKRLSVMNDYSFNWHYIGKTLTITKVSGNRVYTIDNRTAIDTYIHYFGDAMAEGLPAIGIEFPLVTVRDGVSIARAILAKYEDGSLGFAGNFKVGDKVQFGYGDPQKILEYAQNIFKRVETSFPEAIFVYSCMARRHFMPNVVELETLPLEDLAPVTGFFTYGEFFTSDKKELLNQSMTLVSLSENHIDMKGKFKNIDTAHLPSNNSTNALIHLLNVTSEESMEKTIYIEAQNIFEKLFQSSPDGILLIQDNKFIQCNQKIIDIFGYSSQESFLEIKPLDIMPLKQPDGSDSILKIKEMQNLAIQKGSHQFEWVYKKESGEHFWTDIMLTYITINHKDAIYVVCRDISERKEIELELKRQKNILYYRANHDELTGLPNRVLFMSELKKGLEKAQKFDKKLVLMFIDLDRFKKINDSLGHNIGDSFLRIMAERLRYILDKNDMVARLGGDEFLVMVNNVKNHDEILDKATRILQSIKEPIVVEHYTLYSSASIGISRYPIDGIEADNLLKYADTAMYKAKEEGGNNYQFYTKEMTDSAYEHVMMERDLRESIKNGDFEVYYQPQVNIKTGKIVGLEALVRWNHPTVGMLSPDIFIPLSKKTGLIVELDLWVMKCAMKDISKWYTMGLSPGILALNISMKQLEYPYLKDEIEKNIHLYQFNYRWLEFEVTETEMMKNPEKIIGILESLHDLGISVAIDDFGTGYSSLSHLKRLPIDKVKIDKSFIFDIPENRTARAIVSTMIVLAQSLNLEVLAEGVETEEQKDFLLENGCEQIQGYYYSKPVSAKEVEKVLMEYNFQ